MKNKLLTISTLLIIGLAGCAQAQGAVPEISDAIQKYKAQNYVGSLQDALEITQVDPANALAHYYAAISYAQIGDKEKALESYQKVISLSTNSTLKEYAERGELCINNPSECQSGKKNAEIDEELSKFINSAKSISKDVSDRLDEIQIELMKQNINKEVDKKSEMPTDEQIADAVKTLAKIGVNPLAQQTNIFSQAQNSLTQNPEYMQLQMLLGNNNNNNTGNDFMSMLPYFMSQGNGKNSNFSAETIKNMMMSSMIGNLNTTFNFDDK